MLAALSFTLTSCGDDEPDPVPGTIVDEDDNGGNNDNDDPNNPQEIEELLIGTWNPLTTKLLPNIAKMASLDLRPMGTILKFISVQATMVRM